ncbi:MAG TPA: aminoglycoside phosphotransferase family protein [Pyrinomonadaceae bacterium]|nr:aminoglycoside phosphotransferase family protein [Pyrinomonadaceae bacterium]
MKLFEPNNLSRRTPEFTPFAQVSAFVGANVSANNFKIETPSGKYFLKSREQSAVEKMRAEAELTFALGELGQKVPRIIRSPDEELVSSIAGKCWVLYEFQEGDYFSGNGGELLAAAEVFGELTSAAQSLFSDAGVEDAVPGRLIELLDRSSIEVDHRTKILESLSEVEKHRELLNGRVLPMHLDYHPLNLLMIDERVACVVDLEHLKPYSVVSGLGFAAFKLIRQAMVDEEFRERELKERTAVATWLRGWRKSFPGDEYTSGELGIGAKARILTLIQIILGDERLGYDLQKQITSLYEVEVVF